LQDDGTAVDALGKLLKRFAQFRSGVANNGSAFAERTLNGRIINRQNADYRQLQRLLDSRQLVVVITLVIAIDD
jgi:hypothetical protein